MKSEIKRKLLITSCVLLTLYVLSAIYAELSDSADYSTTNEIKNAKPEDVDSVIGMKRKKILTNRNGSTIWFNLEVENICDRGDFDYISSDMKDLGESTLLLTAEPLIQTENPKHLVKIKRKDIIDGSEVNFNFPYSRTKLHYGLFLCSDASGTKSCQRKSIADYTRKNKKENQDVVFFFSYFSVQKGQIEILNNVVGSYAIKQFREYLQKEKDISPEQKKAIFLTILRLTRGTKLRTGSVDVNGERIGLKLTKMGPVRGCANIKRDVISAGRDGKVYITDKNDKTEVAEMVDEDENQ
jgi:hypothetical protein